MYINAPFKNNKLKGKSKHRESDTSMYCILQQAPREFVDSFILLPFELLFNDSNPFLFRWVAPK